MTLREISAAGTSIWLDDLSRERLQPNGKASFLPALIERDYVVGVTTNPAIFSSAIANSDLYRDEIIGLAKAGFSAEQIIEELTTADVKNACDLFLDVFNASNGVDGRVSIEVDPRLARDTEGTIAQGIALWEKVDRPNLLIKVPATVEGLPAITALIRRGISVNVTIIFSVSRYREVLDSFLTGLELRMQDGLSVSDIHSVASFFVSRVDTEIDPRLKSLGEENLLGRAAIANARLAYEHFEDSLNSPRWKTLASQGASIQRPLWASTGVKDPNYEPAMYVTELVAPLTVNTMPEATLDAVRKLTHFKGTTISNSYSDARNVIEELDKKGIHIDEVALKLESEGIEKFIKPWLELIKVVDGATS